MRFNARPALAMPGDYVILSSTDSLARDLIDVLRKEADRPVKPAARTHTLFELDGASAVAALLANRETLVRGDMVKKGRTQAEAEAGIDLLITLVRFVDRLTLDLGALEGRTQMQLQAKLNLPR
jgi:hypothetical protein